METPNCDYIISNPPYSLKGDVIDRLFEIGKPFAMLVGVVGLFESQHRFNLFKSHEFEIMYLNNLKVKCRPQPGFYFGIWGRGSSRLFEHDGKLYMSLNYNEDFEDPQDCEPILGSEFYKVLEELEHSEKK